MAKRPRLPESDFEAMLRDMTCHEIGRLVSYYINEANHEGWEGFSSRDLTGIRRMLVDMKLMKETLEKDPESKLYERYFTGVHYATKD